VFYYKIADENGVVERLFTSNYREYSATEITKEEYNEMLKESEVETDG
jgi:hypothetical protein